MTGEGRSRLYSPELLALATGLAEFPFAGDFEFVGNARSKTCGSTLKLGVDLSPDSTINRVGLQAISCAVGQAAAAILAHGAPGRNLQQIEQDRDGLIRWLASEGALPNWPGIEAIAAARDYPARHGAILLPWNAAIDALCNVTASR